MFAQLTIGSPQWLWPAGLVLAIGAALLWRSYRRSVLEGGLRLAALGLKAAAIVLLAVCLIDPLWSSVRARQGANLFLIVADDSRSLTIQDGGKDRTRAEQLTAMLADSDWQARLGQDFDVRRYRFAERLQSVEALDAVAAKTNGSSLATTLAALRDRFKNRPVAGVLLLTDGNATDAAVSQLDVDGLPPVYPVVLGGRRKMTDVSVVHVAVSHSPFEDAPVKVRAVVRAVGVQGDVVCRLVDEDDKTVSTAKKSAGDDGRATFDFTLRDGKRGVKFYRIEAKPAEQTAGEVTTANNRRFVRIERGSRPKRVLYLGGRPNWEFKFLNRALAEDSQVELTGLIRVAAREAKFDFRGRAGESSNPLFRGFRKDADAETERYDEPVLVRLNVRDKTELAGGFPKQAEELFRFDAIVLDDLEATFFTRDQLDLLEQFVSRRGGGLLMLGGTESFTQGGYARTPLARMLPVYLDRRAVERRAGRYRLALTRDGWLEPWVRLRGTQIAENERIKQMPAFRVFNRTEGIKPGAVPIAEAVDAGGRKHPALIAQRFGHGRVAALTIGDVWRWSLRRDENARDDAARAWRQMLRWLTTDVPQPVQLAVRPSEDARTTNIELTVRDGEFKLLDNAVVSIAVNTPAGKTIKLRAEAAEAEPGLYRATFTPKTSGVYTVTAQVVDEKGRTIGKAASGWAHEPEAEEFRRIAPNRKLLADLAQRTGGEVVAANGLGEFVASLPDRDAPITEQVTEPLWHQWWVFCLAMTCLAGEWGIRRWKGLA